MSSIFDLWKKRLHYLFKLYYQFIAFQFDAVILAYTIGLIGIMGVLYFPIVRQYIFLLSIDPWFTVLQLVALLIMLKGKIKGYLKGADEVFLSPMNSLAKKFTRYSEILCLGLSLIEWGIFVVLLFGINSFLQLGKLEYFVYLFVMGGIFKITYMFLSFICYQRYKSFYGRVLSKMIKCFYWGISYFFINLWFGKSSTIIDYGILGIIVGVFFILVLYSIKKRTIINWSSWIADESKDRARIFGILLQDLSKEKYSSKKATFPMLSGRKLEPFNKRGALLLLYFRMLLRGRGNLVLILQIFLALSSVVFFIKETLTIRIIHFFGVFLMSHLLVSLWDHILEDVWVKVYPLSFKDRLGAFNIGPLVVIIPLIIILSATRTLVIGKVLHLLVEALGQSLLAYGVIYVKSYMLIFKSKL